MRRVALAIVLALGLLPAFDRPARAAVSDWDLPGGGHFYTQTDPTGERGFSVTDADGITFWDTYRRYGGPTLWGYPTSQRFTYLGFTTQVFQRAVFQWDPASGQVNFLNVLDLLHEAGRDGWLWHQRQTPYPAVIDETGMPWPLIVQQRQSWLAPLPAMRARYFSVPDPIAVFGLPTSQIADMGSHYAIRLQRAVLQQWKVDVPWAAAGEVTVALAGDLAREGGLFPEEWIWLPEDPPPPVASVRVAPGERWIDVNLTTQYVTAYVGYQPVYSAPATSGKPGYETPTGNFRILYRVYRETMTSAQAGIRDEAEYYHVEDVYFTQYFAPGGYALHANYWQPRYVFGHQPTSHGCVGMLYDDAAFFWDFASIGTRVVVHY